MSKRAIQPQALGPHSTDLGRSIDRIADELSQDPMSYVDPRGVAWIVTQGLREPRDAFHVL
ncbi:hypothetical protein ACFLU6_12925 [Acidobacteriota bacterium]